MSVQETTIVMCGVKFDYNAFNEDQHNKLSAYEGEPVNGISAVVDGMNGKYVVVGTILAKTKEFEGLEMTDCSAPFEMREKVAVFLQREFDIKLPRFDAVKIYAFTHYS